jgi:hypothetical protein
LRNGAETKKNRVYWWFLSFIEWGLIAVAFVIRQALVGILVENNGVRFFKLLLAAAIFVHSFFNLPLSIS